MQDKQLLRYSRQILLPQIDIVGQQKLLQSRVLIIGAGGLGVPVATYLTAAGVGQITINDFDTIELSNLQRQPLYTEADIGAYKADITAERLHALNSDVQLTSLPQRLDDAELLHQIQQHDLIIDASDNFATRFLINRLCVQQQKPLVSGAAIRFEGQITTFTNHPGTPCYQCLYSNNSEEEINCTTNGVVAPLVGIIGSMQALEAIKLLCAIGVSLQGKVMVFDALRMQWRTLQLSVDPACSCCSDRG